MPRGLEFKPFKTLNENEIRNWFRGKIEDLSSIVITLATSAIEDLHESWGPPGTPGDPIKIKDAANLMASLCEQLVEWERDVKYVLLPSELDDIQNSMLNWTDEFIKEMEKIPIEISQIFKDEHPRGEFVINLELRLPKDFSKTSDQIIEKIRNYCD